MEAEKIYIYIFGDAALCLSVDVMRRNDGKGSRNVSRLAAEMCTMKWKNDGRPKIKRASLWRRRMSANETPPRHIIECRQ